MKKHFLSALLALCLMVTLVPAARAAQSSYDDVKANAWYADEIRWAAENGLMDGVGGGSLLMLWLTSIMHMDYSVAKTVNLLFFLPTALIATLFHKKQGSVDIRKILPGIISACIAAAVFSYIGKHMDTTLLKKLFGGILILTGLRELFYRPRNPK